MEGLGKAGTLNLKAKTPYAFGHWPLSYPNSV